MNLRRQVGYLLRKNLTIKKRNKKEFLQELLVPVYWLLILLAVKLGVPSQKQPAIKTSQIPPVHLSFSLGSSNTTSSKPTIGFVANKEPRALEVVKILEQASNYTVDYRAFNDSEELMKFYQQKGKILPFFGGIVFDKDKGHGGISYTIRVPADKIPGVKTKLTDLGKCRHLDGRFYNPYNCPANEYFLNRQTITMQAYIDAAITMVIGNLSDFVLPNINAQMMPKDEYTPPVGSFNILVPIYMILAFAPFTTTMVIYLVTEKTKKHKELMRIMGMLDTAYWLSWFLTYGLIMIIACLVMTAISVPAGFFGPSNYLAILIIFYLYGLSLITFSFMISPLFQNPKTAGFITTILNTVLGVLVIPLAKPTIPTYAKWLISLFSSTAFAFALNEAVEVYPGVQFSNLPTKGHFPVMNSIIMLIVDTFLYLLLALYLDRVIPAEYGERQPPYFIFLPSFWKGLCCGNGGNGEQREGLTRQLSAREVENPEDVEPVAQEMLGREAISIHKLRKVFHAKEDTVAVDGFSMDIYEGQVTALLGHNGAGKSTLIATLTGMVPPSSGTATIYGKDITKFADVPAIRRTMGVCPQQDVLFEYLTVKEHLQFYSGLKDLQGEDIDREVDVIIKEVGLDEKRDDIAKNLSGGQKRKLCVGIALVGNPKVLFLDEPTSGMDPYSRRTMWSVIQKRAKDRCVLLTTHFMDEADILADYKAIMSKGKLRCAGTSLFLKNRFGIGYHLNTALSQDCDTDRLTSFVKEHVTGADVIRHHGYEMAFALPLEEVASFSGLFAALEENNGGEVGCAAKDLGVTSYGVSMTTLEEVFLQLEDTSEENPENSKDLSTQDTQAPNLLAVNDGNVLMPASSQASGLNHHAGVELNVPEMNDDSSRKGTYYNQQAAGLLMVEKEGPRLLDQTRGLLKVRYLNTIRTPLKVFFQIIVPPILLIVGLVLLVTKESQAPDDTVQFPLAPSYCLTPASKESFASSLLFQNSSGNPQENLLQFLNDYNVGVDQVKSLEGYLNSSSATQRCLGIDIQMFPTTNASSTRKFFVRYNDTTVHSIPVGLNLLGSLYNMYALAKQNIAPWPIKAFLQPLPALSPQWTYDATAFVSVLLIGMAFSVIPGGFGIECVHYRQLGIRHILRVSGLHDIMYWFHFFAADFIVFFIPALLMLILIPALQIASLSPPGAMGCLVIAVLLYIPPNLLLSYCLSFMFSKWESSQSVLPNVFNMCGIVPFVAVSLVDMLGSPDTAIIVHSICACLLPPYGILGALYYIDRVHRFASFKALSDDVYVPTSQYFTWTEHNGIPIVYVALVVHFFLLSILLYFLDSRNTGKVVGNPCACCTKHTSTRKVSMPRRMTSFQEEEPEDDDVREEKERMLQDQYSQSGESSNSYVTKVKGLWKKFGRGKKGKIVVKDLYFGVKTGEVFGLLGPNGAGKTTTLNMMTANFPASRGSVSIAGCDIRTDSSEVFQHLGFCPQTDALLESITLEEHLFLFARIRGVPWNKANSVVNHYMSAMKITEHAKKRAKDLSGGTKRKLSFGMAMLGDPDLLLLDEPSTGMDPSARRFLWNTISRNVTGSRGAILTTHSMEEADALCSRVGIMVKGRLKCLGSTQHLKSKFGSGYSLEIKLSHTQNATQEGDDMQTRLIQFVEQLFPSATRTESFGDRVMYKVPKDNVSRLSNTFAALEEGKRTIGIEEYSFSQSTLEQVFLEFAREQDDERTGAKDKSKEGPDSLPSSYENGVPPV